MRALDAADCIFIFQALDGADIARWIRLNANSCPAYFYGASQVEQLLRESGTARRYTQPESRLHSAAVCQTDKCLREM